MFSKCVVNVKAWKICVSIVNSVVSVSMRSGKTLLGQSVLYCDRDSVIFIQNYNDPHNYKKGIIWKKTWMSWRSTALAPLLRNCIGWF